MTIARTIASEGVPPAPRLSFRFLVAAAFAAYAAVVAVLWWLVGSQLPDQLGRTSRSAATAGPTNKPRKRPSADSGRAREGAA